MLAECDECGNRYDPETAVVIGRSEGRVTSLCPRCGHVVVAGRGEGNGETKAVRG